MMRSVRTQRRCNLVFGLPRKVHLLVRSRQRPGVLGARHRSSLVGPRSPSSAGYGPLGVGPYLASRGSTSRLSSDLLSESLRATATTARFLAFLPPRSAIFSP